MNFIKVIHSPFIYSKPTLHYISHNSTKSRYISKTFFMHLQKQLPKPETSQKRQKYSRVTNILMVFRKMCVHIIMKSVPWVQHTATITSARVSSPPNISYFKINSSSILTLILHWSTNIVKKVKLIVCFCLFLTTLGICTTTDIGIRSLSQKIFNCQWHGLVDDFSELRIRHSIDTKLRNFRD